MTCDQALALSETTGTDVTAELIPNCVGVVAFALDVIASSDPPKRLQASHDAVREAIKTLQALRRDHSTEHWNVLCSERMRSGCQPGNDLGDIEAESSPKRAREVWCDSGRFLDPAV